MTLFTALGTPADLCYEKSVIWWHHLKTLSSACSCGSNTLCSHLSFTSTCERTKLRGISFRRFCLVLSHAPSQPEREETDTHHVHDQMSTCVTLIGRLLEARILQRKRERKEENKFFWILVAENEISTFESGIWTTTICLSVCLSSSQLK